MAIFVGTIAVISIFLFLPLKEAFHANIFLNGLILGVLILGIMYNFRQVLILFPEVAWLEGFKLNRISSETKKQPRLLASMAALLGENKSSFVLSTQSMRSILDGIFSRLDESRDLSRYTIGLLIFLGLLGTFWGLLETVGSIRHVIGGLSISGTDFASVFENLKSGLTAPLDGMGTAFSSSLFGLAGSLVLGFLDLQAGQAQNRFFNDLEEWLSSVTHLPTNSVISESDAASPAYINAMLEKIADSLEHLQNILFRSEENNIASNKAILGLRESLSLLNDQKSGEQRLVGELLQSQIELKSLLQELSLNEKERGNFWDETSQSHLQNIDLQLSRLTEELSNGRDNMIYQIRSEIKLLARTISSIPKND